jgi:nucleotide-binding universal stress UspA family protein
MKILLAIDHADSAESTVEAVIDQFRSEPSEVLVLHVLQPVEPVPAPEMAQGYAPELEGEQEPARALVEHIANLLRSSGFKADADVQIGDPTMNILDTAAEWNAGLIVLGAHGKRDLQNLLIGSVAQSVARQAKCSVEIVRKPSAH